MMRNSKWLSNGSKQVKCTVKKLRTMTASPRQEVPKLREFCIPFSAELRRGLEPLEVSFLSPGDFLNGVITWD